MRRLLALAFGLSLVMALELAAGAGFFAAFAKGTLPARAFPLLALLVATGVVAVIHAFAATVRQGPTRLASAIAAAACASLAGLEAGRAGQAIPGAFHFAFSLIADLGFAWGATFAFTHSLKLSGPWATRPPVAAAAAVLAYAGLGFLTQSFVPLEISAIRLAFVRDLGIFAAAAATLGAVAFARALRLDPKSAKESLILRLPDRHDLMDGTTGHLTFVLLAGGIALSPLVQLILRLTAGEVPELGRAALGVVSVAWVAFAFLAYRELGTVSKETRHGQVTARLTSPSARKFLARHMGNDSAWAATVGLKTANFVIDHDPDGYLHAKLPASIMQLRAEEIRRSVDVVLGPMHLHGNAVGHRISGALDPEASLRPCIDSLKLFSSLYLDAGPLVERRINGLAALLPIVDPGLAKLVKERDLAGLMRRNLWFFHFDFGWIDQHVVHTQRATRYEVRMATLPSRVRHAMMDHLTRTGGVGNFVWLGPEARDRIVQEAPTMAHIIEACPIQGAGGKDGSDELLMFMIKFEQLIPRLQRYYDLDSMRRELIDFEPSHESSRLHALLKLQITKAQNATALIEVLTSISTVPWKGFKEKDNALQLVLAVYGHAREALGGGEFLLEAKDAKMHVLHEKLLDAVRLVGYPSQILHDAQRDKLALRDVPKLIEVAKDPKHPRFHEAWILASTTEFHRHPAERRLEMLRFLTAVGQNPELKNDALVQAKTVDSLCGLARAAHAGAPSVAELAAMGAAFEATGKWFAAEHVEPDTCVLLLDARAFVLQHLRGEVNFSDTTAKALDETFKKHVEELGAQHPKVATLLSRWQEQRQKIEKKASPSAA